MRLMNTWKWFWQKNRGLRCKKKERNIVHNATRRKEYMYLETSKDNSRQNEKEGGERVRRGGRESMRKREGERESD